MSSEQFLIILCQLFWGIQQFRQVTWDKKSIGNLFKVSSMPSDLTSIWFWSGDMVLKFHHFLQGIEWKSQIFKIFFNWVFRNFIKSQHKVWHFLLAFWGFKWHHFLPKITEVAILSLMKFLKIPLWYEIYSFDNSVKVYRSISGHTFENESSEKPGRKPIAHILQ